MERMDEYHLDRSVLMADVERGYEGDPRLGWMNGMKGTLGNRGMTVEAVRQCMKDKKEHRALVLM